MIDDQKNENHGTEAAGHDVEKAQVKRSGLTLTSDHSLVLEVDQRRFYAIVSKEPAAREADRRASQGQDFNPVAH